MARARGKRVERRSYGGRLGLSRHPWLPALALAAITILAYLPALDRGFIWDDDTYVTRNSTLHDLNGLRRIWFEVGAVPQYYPLVHTTFWIENHLWGLAPFHFHLGNVLLHALAAVLLWRVLARLELPGAWLGAALFALHPVGVESVAWITERKNVLSTVFYFAAALAYLRFAWPRQGGKERGGAASWYFAALGLYVCALWSKTVTCSLPAALLLVFWWKEPGGAGADPHHSSLRRQALLLAPFFAAGLSLGLLTAWMEKHIVGAHGAVFTLSLAQRCLIAGRALWFYAGKLLWPAPLVFIYPRWTVSVGVWWQWLFPAGAVAVVAALWAARGRIGRGPLVAVLFFAGTLFPALGFVNVYPMRYSFVADHFQYLAGVGLLALIAAGVARYGLPQKSRQEGLFAGSGLSWWPMLVLLVLAGLTWRQTRIYANTDVLWQATLRHNPDCWLAHNNLGAALFRTGQVDEAIGEFHEALRLNPDYPESHNGLGGALGKKGQTDDAIREFREAIRLESDYADARYNLSFTLLKQGRTDEGVSQLLEACRLKPEYEDDCNRLVGFWIERGEHLEEARALAGNLVQRRPNNAAFLDTMGRVLLKSNRPAQALEYLLKAVEISPAPSAPLYDHLGDAYAALNQREQAEEAWRKAVSTQPNSEIQKKLAGRHGFEP